jgi:hypothetical protein
VSTRPTKRLNLDFGPDLIHYDHELFAPEQDEMIQGDIVVTGPPCPAPGNIIVADRLSHGPPLQRLFHHVTSGVRAAVPLLL